MRVAVLGLGRMGAAIAGRLIDAGHEVHVWNRTVARAKPLARRGAVVEPSPGAAAGEVDVVITSLTDDQAVRGVVLGDGPGDGGRGRGSMTGRAPRPRP